MPYKDPEKKKEHSKKYYQLTKEKQNEKSKIYYQKNKDKIIKRCSEYNKSNPEKHKKYVYNWRDKNPDKTQHMYIIKEYGISSDQYKELLTKQNNLCKICKRPETTIDPRNKKLRRLCIDHDHKTGKVRGLLCQKCNSMLGFFDDNIQILENAISYLKEYDND